MPEALRITDAQLVPVTARDRASGLLGFVSFVVNGVLRVDGLTLRRTRDGRIALSFPARRDSHGHDHPIIRPVDAEARTAIVGGILQALSIDPGGAE